MIVLILVLLALCGALFVGQAYQAGRVQGAAAGASWLLAASVIAGQNVSTAWHFAYAHPFYSLVIFVALLAAFFFVGPGSAAWQAAARYRPVRVASLLLRRFARRRGLSPRLAGDAAAMAAALMVLALVSLLTLPADPSYAYAAEKVERLILHSLPDEGRLSDAASEQARARYLRHPRPIDPEGAAAAERVIAEGIERGRELIRALKLPQKQIEDASDEISKLAAAGRARLPVEMDQASHKAVFEAFNRMLGETRGRRSASGHRAIRDALPMVIARAQRAIADTPATELSNVTPGLVADAVENLKEAGRAVVESETQELLEENQAAMEESGKAASRARAEQVASATREAIGGVADRLKQEAKAAQTHAAEAQQKEREDAARREASRRDWEAFNKLFFRDEKERERLMGRFFVLPKTRFSGGRSMGDINVASLPDCAEACLEVGCEAFAFGQAGMLERMICHRYRGPGIRQSSDERYTGGRLR